MSSARTSVPLNDKSASASGHRGHDKPATRGHLGEADAPQEKLKNKQPARSLANGTLVREAVMPPTMGPNYRTHTNPVTQNTTMEVSASHGLPLVSGSSSSGAAAGAAFDGASPSRTLSVTEIPPRTLSVAENPLCANGCSSASTIACSGCDRATYCNEACQHAHWFAAHRLVCSASKVESQPAQPAAAASSRRQAPAQPAAAAASSRRPRRLCAFVWKGKECPHTSDPEARSCAEGDHKLVCSHFTHKSGNRCKKGELCTFIHPGKKTAVGDCAAAASRWTEICAERDAERVAKRNTTVAAQAFAEAPVAVSSGMFAALAEDAPMHFASAAASVYTPVQRFRAPLSRGFGSLIECIASAGRLVLSPVQHWHAMQMYERMECLTAVDFAKYQRQPSGVAFRPVLAGDERLVERSALGLCTRAISHLLNSSRNLESEPCDEGCMKGLSWNQRDRTLLDLCMALHKGTETFASIYGNMVRIIQSGVASRLLSNPHVARAWHNMPDVPKLVQADLENMQLIFNIITQCIKVARNPKVREGWQLLGMTPESTKKYIAFMQLFAPMCPRSMHACRLMLSGKAVPASHICTYTCDTCVQGTHLPEVDLAMALVCPATPVQAQAVKKVSKPSRGQKCCDMPGKCDCARYMADEDQDHDDAPDSVSVVRAVKASKFAPIRVCYKDAMHGVCDCNRAMTEAESTANSAATLDSYYAASAEREKVKFTLVGTYGTTVVSERAALEQQHVQLVGEKGRCGREKSNSKKQQDKGVTVWTAEKEAKMAAFAKQIQAVGATDAKPEVRALREQYEQLSGVMHELSTDFLTNLFPLIHGTTDMGQVALMQDRTLVSLKPKLPYSDAFSESGLQAKVMSAETKEERAKLRQLMKSLRRWAPVAPVSKAVVDYQLQRKKDIWFSTNESDQAEVERLKAMFNSFEAFVACLPKYLDPAVTGHALDLARTVEGRADFDEFLASKPLAGTTFADFIAKCHIRPLALPLWRESKQAVAWDACKYYVRLGLTSEAMPLATFATHKPTTMKLWVGVNKERDYVNLNLVAVNAERVHKGLSPFEPLEQLSIDAFLADQETQVQYFYSGGHKFCDLTAFEEAKLDGWRFILNGTYKTMSQGDMEAFVDKLAAMVLKDPLLVCSFDGQIAQGQAVLVAVAACRSDEEKFACMLQIGVTEASLAAIPLMIESNTELIAAVTAKVEALKEAAAKEAPKAAIAKAAAAVRVKRAAEATVVEAHQTVMETFFQGEDQFAKELKLHYRMSIPTPKGKKIEILHESLPTWVKQRKVNGELRRLHVADVTEDAVRKEEDVQVRFLAIGPFPTLGMATECVEAIEAFPHSSSIMPRVEPYFGEHGDEEGFIRAVAECKDLMKQMRRDKKSGSADVPCAALFGGCYMVVIPHVKGKEATRKDKQAFKRAVATEDWEWVRGLIEFIAPKLDLQPCDFWTNMRATESTRTWLESVQRVSEESDDESESESDDDVSEADSDEFGSDENESVNRSRLFARLTSTKATIAAPVAAAAATSVAATSVAAASKPTKPGQQKRLTPEQVRANMAAKKAADAAAKAAPSKAAAPKAPSPPPKAAASIAAPQPVEEEEEEEDDEEDEDFDEEEDYSSMYEDGNVRASYGKK